MVVVSDIDVYLHITPSEKSYTGLVFNTGHIPLRSYIQNHTANCRLSNHCAGFLGDSKMYLHTTPSEKSYSVLIFNTGPSQICSYMYIEFHTTQNGQIDGYLTIVLGSYGDSKRHRCVSTHKPSEKSYTGLVFNTGPPQFVHTLNTTYANCRLSNHYAGFLW